jgi:hypothetical protein
MVPGELAELASEFRALVPACHWMIELPEVFWAKRRDPLDDGALDGRAWIDALVGNPPFIAGGAVSTVLGPAYRDWLLELHDGSHGNADLSAHFFRRASQLLGVNGTVGFVATTTIAQGDTRETGLAYLVPVHRGFDRLKRG